MFYICSVRQKSQAGAGKASKIYGRLTGAIDENLSDAAWVEKLPTPAFAPIANEFAAIVDAHVGQIENLRYTWRLLRDNLHACHVYLTPQEIFIRPLIQPTWT